MQRFFYYYLANLWVWSHNFFYSWLGNTAALYLCKQTMGQKKNPTLQGNGIEKVAPDNRPKPPMVETQLHN